MKSFLDEVAKEIINSGRSFKELKICDNPTPITRKYMG